MIDDYPVISTWQEHDVLEIPIDHVQPTRSATAIRRLSAYTEFVNKFLNGYNPETPLLCYIDSDGVIRVKHGNLLFWVAKETKQLSTVKCVFAGGAEKTDALLDTQRNELGIKNKYF